MESNYIFYQRLNKLLKESNKSSNQAERELGYPRNALNNYKNGGIPSAQRLLELAQYFDVTPEYLFGFKAESESHAVDKNFDSLDIEHKKDLLVIIQHWLLKDAFSDGK